MHERFKNFTNLIAGISRSIYRLKLEAMAKFDLKSSHVSCIYYLYQEIAHTATELCEVCEEDKANISRALRELEEEGHIVRQKSARGRPTRRLSLTESGMEIGKSLSMSIIEVMTAASVGISDGDRDIMYKSLFKIDANLLRLTNFGE